MLEFQPMLKNDRKRGISREFIIEISYNNNNIILIIII